MRTPCRRRRVLLACALAALAALPPSAVLLEAAAWSVDLGAHEGFCLFEPADAGDIVAVSFETSNERGQSMIDFIITGEDGNVAVRETGKEIGFRTVEANKTGNFHICFSNERWAENGKRVLFNIRSTRKADDPSAVTDPLEKEVRRLVQEVSQVDDEQEYIVMRETAHRDTAESTNVRVVWWSFFETTVVVLVCLWQVWYLRRFFEVKRIV